MDTPSELELLATLPIFGGLSDDELGKVLEVCSERAVAEGEVVLREGEPASACYVIRRGRVEVVANLDGEAPCRLAELDTGDCFGEMALIDVEPRSASVRALEPTELLRLDRGSFLQLQSWSLQTYTLIVLNMAREISRRLRQADARIVEMGTRGWRAEGRGR